MNLPPEEPSLHDAIRVIADIFESDESSNFAVRYLLESGACTAQCLCAYDPLGSKICTCPCRGRFHGMLGDEAVEERAFHPVWSAAKEPEVRYIDDGPITYCWHEARPNILAEGATPEDALACLERLTAAWGHESNPESFIFKESYDG